MLYNKLFLLFILSVAFQDVMCLLESPVVVVGGTGRVGRTIVKDLLARGVETRCLVRDIEKASNIEEIKGVKFVEGNVYDINSMLEVTKDAGAVIDCHGVSPPRFSKPIDIFRHPRNANNHPYTINFIGTKTLITAMTLNKCRKLVRVTGALTGKSPFVFAAALFNLILSMTCKWHERSEIAIRESGLDYTVIRPTGIRDVPCAKDNNRSLLLIPGDSEEQVPLPGQISVKDVAELCVTSLLDATLTKSTVVISSIEGAEGARDWNSLIPTKVKPDTIPIKRRWHNFATTLMGFSVASFIALFGKGLTVLSSFFFRMIRKAILNVA